MIKKKHIIFHPISLLSMVAAFFCSLSTIVIHQTEALNQTYTVCPAGCDVTTLVDALALPGLSEDTIVLTQNYIFDHANETIGGTILNIPTSITLSCEAGADTFGDKNEAEIELTGSTDVTIQDCTTENVKISLFGTNVKLLNNTFSSETDSWIILTGVDGYEISGNSGIQRIQLQGADNGVIENNEIECRFSGCVNVVTAGAPDYNDPMNIDPNISNNVLITENTITNYATTNIGDWVLVNGGKNIQFTNNTILSDVVMDDVFMTLVSIQNAQAEFTGNTIIAPEKVMGATQVTWAFNIRTNEYDVDALYEHNTIYARNGDSCFGLFDGGGNPNIPIDIEANYNLCYQSDASSGTAVSLQYSLGSSDVTLTDTFNGFYGFTNLIYDSTGTITSLNANTLASDPLLRTENADPTDDYYPSPVSRYLDINGGLDIGAFSDARVSNIFIDQNCTVDYTSCHSATTAILPHALKTNDVVQIAAGTYPGFTSTETLNNITITGSGATTIIDAAGVGSAMSLANFNNSEVSNILLQNSNASVTSTYEITHQLYEYNGNTYDQSTAAVGNPNIALLFGDTNCNALLLSADATNVNTAVGAATDDWNLGLIDLFGSKITILVPNRFVSSGPDLVTYTTNNCGAAITVDLFLPSIFTVNSGNYTYNAAAVALAGVSLKPGLTSPPELTRNVSITAAGGLFLQNSNNNTFQGISYSANTIGLYLDPDSNGNSFFENTFSSNTSFDLSSEATGNNTLDQTTFDLNKVQIDGTGLINVYYRARAFIQKGSTPIQNASVTFTDAQNNVEGPLLTDALGMTPYTNSLLAIVLDETNPHVVTSGNLNPFTVKATTPNGVIFITENLSQANQQFEIEENSGRRRGKNLECTDCTIPESENEGIAGGGGGSSTSPQHEVAEESMTSSFTGYDDLTSEDQDFEAFKFAYEQGIFTGHADNTVRADDALQRDQAAKIVAHFSREYSVDKDYCQGKKPFRDISLHFWGAQVICFGKQTGSITGYTDKNIYLPAKPMNRAEFLALILRSLPDLEWTDSPSASYRDVLPNKWYSSFAKFAYEQELFLTSKFQKLFPDRYITRREVVRIIYKLREFRASPKIIEPILQNETIFKIKNPE